VLAKNDKYNKYSDRGWREKFLLRKISSNMTANEIMNKHVVTIDSNRTAADAARLMTTEGTGYLVVTEDDLVVGIVTERDMIIRVLAQDMNAKNVKVEEFMTKNVISFPPSATVSEVIQAMIRNRIRRVPIVYKDRLVGIVTADDLALLSTLQTLSY
jgi:CBS domain-containing protein